MAPPGARDDGGRRAGSPRTADPELDRRAFGALAVGSPGAALAGCMDQGTAVDDDLEGRVATVYASGLSGRVELNPYRTRTAGFALFGQFQHLVLPVDVATGEYRTSGHEWTVGDEPIEVPTAIRDYEIEPPDGVRLEFDDRLTYWNGDPLDARAYYLDDSVRWLADYGAFSTEERGDDLESDTLYYRSFFDPRPGNRSTAHGRVHPGSPPLPPTFTESWADRLDDAGSREAVDSAYVDLADVSIDFEDVVEEGYGSGVYELESPEDVGSERLVGHRREDHPGDTVVDHLAVVTVDGGGERSLIESGGVDVTPGIAAEIGGTVDRDSLAEGIEQLATFPDPTRHGYQLLVDWRNHHLRRLWVRRALVAAIGFDDVVDTAWGPLQRPPSAHAGMLPFADETALGSEFVSSLHDYPIGRDRETAERWIETAGYAKASEAWYDADGSLLNLTLLIPEGSTSIVTACELIADDLRSFGVPTNLERSGSDSYARRVEDGEFDLTIGLTPAGWQPADYYASDAGIASELGIDRSAVDAADRGLMILPSTAIPGNPLGSCPDQSGPVTNPGTVTLPGEPGALRIDGIDYDDGGATYLRSESAGRDHSVCEAATALTETVDDGTVRYAARTCARWYNYALPGFVFARPNAGVLGNAADFRFPGETDRSHRTRDEAIDLPGHYHVQAGLVR